MNILDFTTIVKNQVTTIQAQANTVIDFTVGSVMRAIVEANASVSIWLQSLISQLLVTSRASTSTGIDLDSWAADYGVSRIQAIAATGTATFSRFTPTQSASIPVGTTVENADGSVSYAVIADPLDVNYVAVTDSYTLAQSVSSITVPVTSTTAGANGNAAPASITVLATSIPGVDTVSNTSQFTSGADQETDAALRVRFVSYLSSLSKAVKVAVEYAILLIQTNIKYSITENYNYDGTPNNGYFFVVIDDGTSYPTDLLLASIGNAIDAVRPLCSQFGVYRAVILNANVSMVITTSAGYDHATVVAAVSASLVSYISSIGLGNPLRYTMLSKIAYDVAGVANVTSISLNGGTADLIATGLQTIRPNTILVT
jgi:uncharacterized phage protein gp47/JayE